VPRVRADNDLLATQAKAAFHLLQVQFVEKIRKRRDMRIEGILASLLAAAASLLTSLSSVPSQAQHPPSALIGHIASDREGAMEGVIVSAKKDGSTITVSVVSDGQGQYAFPASKLVGGRYSRRSAPLVMISIAPQLPMSCRA
jgi:hypothetical protein